MLNSEKVLIYNSHIESSSSYQICSRQTTCQQAWSSVWRQEGPREPCTTESGSAKGFRLHQEQQIQGGQSIERK
jgi:hypothetical protein